MNHMQGSKGHYDSIDKLRVFSAIGIILMHVLANGNYQLHGFVFEHLISFFTELVFLFMIISGFSMCCGYYDKIVNNTISFASFYSKRFAKAWPFFALLCVMDFVISPSLESAYEVLANLTLCFGFIPDAHISVIGVGWFLGLVFVFYMIFPFFCYLLMNKRRAWLSFFAALLLNYLCVVHYDAGRTSIAYSGVFFMAGGMIFLYRRQLSTLADKYCWLLWLGAAAGAGVYFRFGLSTLTVLTIFSLVMITALKSRQGRLSTWISPVVKKLSEISMEMYLSHMVIFRVIEKLGFTHLFSSELASYVTTAAGTVLGTILFSVCVKIILNKIGCIIGKFRMGENDGK